MGLGWELAEGTGQVKLKRLPEAGGLKLGLQLDWDLD